MLHINGNRSKIIRHITKSQRYQFYCLCVRVVIHWMLQHDHCKFNDSCQDSSIPRFNRLATIKIKQHAHKTHMYSFEGQAAFHLCASNIHLCNSVCLSLAHSICSIEARKGHTRRGRRGAWKGVPLPFRNPPLLFLEPTPPFCFGPPSFCVGSPPLYTWTILCTDMKLLLMELMHGHWFLVSFKETS